MVYVVSDWRLFLLFSSLLILLYFLLNKEHKRYVIFLFYRSTCPCDSRFLMQLLIARKYLNERSSYFYFTDLWFHF